MHTIRLTGITASSRAGIGHALASKQAGSVDRYDEGCVNSTIAGEHPTALLIVSDEKSCTHNVLQKDRRSCSIEFRMDMPWWQPR